MQNPSPTESFKHRFFRGRKIVWRTMFDMYMAKKKKKNLHSVHTSVAKTISR